MDGNFEDDLLKQDIQPADNCVWRLFREELENFTPPWSDHYMAPEREKPKDKKGESNG